MRLNRLTGITFGEIQLFELIARSGSIASAARVLGVTPSTATRKLLSLEAALDVKLFNRSTRQLNLTEAGQAALAWARMSIVELDSLSEDLAAATGLPSGRIRMAAPHFGMNSYLPKVLSAFLRLYPQITLDLTTSDDQINLIEHGFDVAIQYGILPDSRIVGVRLAEFSRQLCASPAYIERFGLPTRLQDLVDHKCIVHRQTDPVNWTFRRDSQVFHQPIRSRVEVDNSYCSFDFCINGAGLARLARSAIGSAKSDGKLIEVLPEYICADLTGENPSLWLIHNGEGISHRVRLLVDFLKKELPQERRNLFNA